KLADPVGSANGELMQGERKGQRPFAREGCRKRAFVPGLQTRRSGDRQRPRALGDQLRVKHEERDAAKMVGVEMREQDEIDAGAVDREPLQRDQRRGAAVNQKGGSFGGHMEARIEAPARPERVSGTDERNPQTGPPALVATAHIYAK